MARHIDGDVLRRLRPERAPPGRQLLAGVAQHPRSDGIDQARFFGDGDDLVGRDGAPRRVVPSQQRLDGDEAVGGQIDYRLEGHRQAVVIERLAQLADQREPLLQLRSHLLVEDGVAVLARLLGLVHGDVGVGDKRLDRGGRVVGHDDADAGRHDHFLLVEHDRSNHLG